jgi:hypothetical protein
MPAMIVFGSARGGGKRGANPATEAVRVSDDPAEVVRKLAAADNGLTSFELDAKVPTTIWVNRHLVRMVREVQGK